jgi:type IV pilus assembly protein PilM
MLGSNWIAMNQRVQPIGLDLGHRSLKMAQVALTADCMRVLTVKRAPIDPPVAGDGREERQALVHTIKRLLAEGDFKGRNVVSALPVDRLKITSVRLAATDAPDADELLRKEAAERFGLDPATDAINYLLAGSVHQGEELKNEYILLAADNETIADHIALLEEAGLTPVGIDAPACALFRTFERTMRRQEDREKTIIFLDIGHRYTIVVFGRAGEICFIKHLPIGISHFSDEIALVLGVTVNDAELLRLKLQQDEPIEASTRRSVIDALNTVAEQLAGEISLCLRYYTVTFRGKRVERAVIAGGGTHEQVLLDVLRRHLSVRIEIAEPLRGSEPASGRVGRDCEEGSADLALAVGLSLKGQDSPGPLPAGCTVQPEPVLEREEL